MNASQTAKDFVRAIYDELARRPIDRNCVRVKECCHFKLTGRTPFLTRGEAIVAAQALRATGRTELPAVNDGRCPMLETATGDCLIYENRPFGCRTHFCAAAGGPYARREVIDLIRRLEELDAKLGGNGPRKIEEAVRTELQELRQLKAL
jgi:uncharacterized protein